MAATTDALLIAAQELSLPELDRLADGLAVLRARRAVEADQPGDDDLIGLIRAAVPLGLLRRAADLRRKRRAGVLSPDEHDELVSLTDLIEQRNARRLLYLAQLAHRRGRTLEQTIADLGIQAPEIE